MLKLTLIFSICNFSFKFYLNHQILTNTYKNSSPLTRPLLKFNELDGDIERRSIIKYTVENKLPLNPMGRTGTTGRNQYRYWGPNHALLAIFSR
jgi:hypothetical protein